MTAEELIDAVDKRQCVVFPTTQRHMPAAVVVNMMFRDVMRMLPRMKLYKRAEKRGWRRNNG